MTEKKKTRHRHSTETECPSCASITLLCHPEEERGADCRGGSRARPERATIAYSTYVEEPARTKAARRQAAPQPPMG